MRSINNIFAALLNHDSSEMETVLLAADALSAIMEASGGDMRKAVTFLQSSHQLSAGSPVTTSIVTDISGQVRNSLTLRYHISD